MNENRNERWARLPACEPLLGRPQSNMAKATSFSRMPEPAEIGAGAFTIEEAAANQQGLAPGRIAGRDVVEIAYLRRDGEKVDPNETVSQERASPRPECVPHAR